MIYKLYLHHGLLLFHCARLGGDRDRDLERLHEPEWDEEYEYLLLLGGERDAEQEDRDDERDEELELLSELRGQYLHEEKGMHVRKLAPSRNQPDVLTAGQTFS